MTLIRRPTPGALLAAVVGAVLPVALASGAVAAPPAPIVADAPWWVTLLIAAASPACAWGASILVGAAMRAAAAYLRERGRAALEDGDPTNDPAARAQIAAADELERRAATLETRK
jgi:hypothetical protein